MQKAVTESFSRPQSCLTGLVLGNAKEASCSKLRTIINNLHLRLETLTGRQQPVYFVGLTFSIPNERAPRAPFEDKILFS